MRRCIRGGGGVGQKSHLDEGGLPCATFTRQEAELVLRV
jgi:hypothetical protein